MASTLYLDCISGISGDMFLAGLLDLGLDPKAVEKSLASLRLEEHVHLHTHRETRCGISGTHLNFEVHHHDCGQAGHSHSHSHDHHDHPDHDHGHTHDTAHGHGRSFTAIKQLIARSNLPDLVKSRAISVFRRIGLAESRIHGVGIEEIHFHEVGAIDSIADIVGVCSGLHLLGIKRVLASPLVEGRGTLACAHGTFPIPAPATLAILEGVPLTQIDVPFELITPTGAALLAEFAESFTPLASFATEKIGYGLGTRDLPGRPNVVRMLLGDTIKTQSEPAPGYERDEVAVLTTQIDDVTSEVLAAAVEALMDAGALDVGVGSVTMKKGRSGFRLEVLCATAEQERLAALVLKLTPAIGLRVRLESRIKLPRSRVEVPTPWGPVAVKEVRFPDGSVRRKAEFEDCRRLANAHGLPVADVIRLVERERETR
ncbi:MAG: nickel pincer cofactor biosynthesis protein LarC [Candidatus Methylacidiphilales bacterium]|nr:nickel pincer cofactor biosynthesis protein LarC [Candidatus Methylacidiphilales bacterium]